MHVEDHRAGIKVNLCSLSKFLFQLRTNLRIRKRYAMRVEKKDTSSCSAKITAHPGACL